MVPEFKAKRLVNKSKKIKNSVTLSTEIKRKRNNRQIKCYICNKWGHNARDCWHNPKNKNKKGNKKEQAKSLDEKGKQIKNSDNKCNFADTLFEDYKTNYQAEPNYCTKTRCWCRNY